MSKISDAFEQFTAKIKEQEWYQQLEASFERLPPDQQKMVKMGAWAVGGLSVLIFTWTMVGSANDAKSEYYEKYELLQTLNQATDELRRLRGQNAGMNQGGTANWKQFFQNDSIEVLKETPGATQSVLQETLLDLEMKAVGLRQMVQALYKIEHGSPPMKLRALQVENGAGDGLLSVKFSVSAYSAKPEKAEKSERK